ncbi:MAG: hypothetical protein U1F21_01650 [Sphaerotilus natans]
MSWQVELAGMREAGGQGGGREYVRRPQHQGQPALQLVRSEPEQEVPPLIRKFRKFRSNPIMFMRDSKHPMLKAIGWSIRHD